MRRAVQLALIAVAVCAAAGASLAGNRAATPRPLLTAVVDPAAVSEDPALAMRRIRAAGATVVRLVLPWEAVAPAWPAAGFDAANPDDPAYSWGRFDDDVRTAAASGLDVLAVVVGAPPWAQDRPPEAPPNDASWRVRPTDLAAFARAAASRYAGRGPLPRVRYWQAWNEPNYTSFLNPQLASQLERSPSLPLDADDVVSPDQYRLLVNAFSDAVHGVDPTNVVIAGGLLPFQAASAGIGVSVGPLLFMRKLLCMSGGAAPRPTCGDEVRFDVWSTHPYTVGGPVVQATSPDDVSIGDLPEMNRLLRAAEAAGHVRPARPLEFWVTEFGWDTKPPDSYGVPLALHARWVAEALYRMWTSGVSLVAWFGLRDDDLRGRPEGSVIQSGLYFRGESPAADRPKPTLSAFRFPFVAFPVGKRMRVWGRLPPGRTGSVVVQQSGPDGWRRLAALRPDANGIFQAVLGLRGSGFLIRARLADRSLTSVPFSLRRPPDLVVNPFGGPVG